MDGSHLRNAESSLTCYSIVVRDNETSERGFVKLVQSSLEVDNQFNIERFDAVTEDNVVTDFHSNKKMEWTYPWEGRQTCLKSGLTKSAYQTKNRNKRVACFMSHYHLWEKCVALNNNILVLEHDAQFIKKLDLSILEKGYDIIGINNPIGATRKAKLYDEIIKKNKPNCVIPVPRIDDWDVPQGLAGNSAYIIKPAGAKALIDKVYELGAWPNDALMCYQNIKRLGVSTTYYTKVQGLPSLTTQ